MTHQQHRFQFPDRRGIARLGVCLAAVLAASCATQNDSQPAPTHSASVAHWQAPFAQLELVADLQLATASFSGVPVGGLSGLVWDDATDSLIAVSDDGAERGPARAYRFTFTPSTEEGEATWDIVEQIELKRTDGTPFPSGYIDAESIDLVADRWLISSEGGNSGQPFVAWFSNEGEQVETLSLPDYFLPGPGQGTRPNLALEGVSALPDGTLFAAIENALVQDGPEAGWNTPSRVRILRWQGQGPPSEFAYWTDPVVDEPPTADTFHTNGLVEILALDSNRLLTLERSYTAGNAPKVRLYWVDLADATDIAGVVALDDTAVPARKVLLADLADLGIFIDNLEGLTWGPRLADGRRTLLMVSDNNFSPLQKNQLLVFAVSDRVPTVSEIQGAVHRSPHERDWLFGVEGVVTGVVATPGRSTVAWIQTDGDGDLNTSDGLHLRWNPDQTTGRPGDWNPSVGDRVQASGFVRELGGNSTLPVTALEAFHLQVIGKSDLPAAVLLDPSGGSRNANRMPFTPLPLDDGNAFSPGASAIDRLEVLEGMRVTLPPSTAVSGTSRFGDIALLPDGAQGVRSPAGGVLLTAEDFNTQRLIAAAMHEAPTVRVGDRFDEPISGVLDYSFGNYKLHVEEWPPVTAAESGGTGLQWSGLQQAGLQRSGFQQSGFEANLTFATYNVLNLDPGDGPQFDRVAKSIAEVLESPHILALQEIQDDNGPDDEGVTSADLTLNLLIDAIRDQGGAEYEYAQIDPVHNEEGGQPVGNIRVAYLYRPDRVQLRQGMPGDSYTSVMVTGAAQFEPSPGRVAVDDPSFAGSEARNWERNRPCLAAEFWVDEKLWQFVNCHLKSKRGDERLFGPNQPPVFHTEKQRAGQTQAVADLVGDLFEINPEARLVVLGDTNEHEFRSPVQILKDAGLTNLVDQVPLGQRYSFNFNGNSQILDNVLVSPAIVQCEPEVSIAHINADLPDTDRASDHDPIVVRVANCA